MLMNTTQMDKIERLLAGIDANIRQMRQEVTETNKFCCRRHQGLRDTGKAPGRTSEQFRASAAGTGAGTTFSRQEAQNNRITA